MIAPFWLLRMGFTRPEGRLNVKISSRVLLCVIIRLSICVLKISDTSMVDAKRVRFQRTLFGMPARYTVDFANIGVTGKRDIDRIRDLRGWSVWCASAEIRQTVLGRRMAIGTRNGVRTALLVRTMRPFSEHLVCFCKRRIRRARGKQLRITWSISGMSIQDR
jgi:hypothetical protein